MLENRPWVQYPQNIEVRTSYGSVWISCTGYAHDHVYVDANSNGRGLKYRGKHYPICFHIGRYDGQWALYRDENGQPGRVYCDAPPTYKHKLVVDTVAHVAAFLAADPGWLRAGRIAQANNHLGKMEREERELMQALIAKRAERVKAEEALEAALASEPAQPEKAKPDVHVTNHGTMFTVWLLSDAAKAWAKENVEVGDHMWLTDDRFGVEHRYIGAIVEGMQAAGLEVV